MLIIIDNIFNGNNMVLLHVTLNLTMNNNLLLEMKMCG